MPLRGVAVKQAKIVYLRTLAKWKEVVIGAIVTILSIFQGDLADDVTIPAIDVVRRSCVAISQFTGFHARHREWTNRGEN